MERAGGINFPAEDTNERALREDAKWKNLGGNSAVRSRPPATEKLAPARAFSCRRIKFSVCFFTRWTPSSSATTGKVAA